MAVRKREYNRIGKKTLMSKEIQYHLQEIQKGAVFTTLFALLVR